MDVELLTPVSKRREAVDCFNCSASHRQCDRTRHRCETCSRCLETCGGYPRKWQWLAGVKSRGKHKGRSMSIAASSREWQSTTPINHTFVFKQGAPQKKRSKCGVKDSRPRLARANNTKATASLEPSGPVVLSSLQPQLSHPSALLPGEHQPPSLTPAPVVDTVNQSLSLTPEVLCDLTTCDPVTCDLNALGYVDPTFEGFDLSLMHDFNADGGNMLVPPVPIGSAWPDQTSLWPSPIINRPESPRLSLFALPAVQTSELLTLCMSKQHRIPRHPFIR